MSHTIKCPNCKKPLQIRKDQIEEKLVCPSCRSSFRVKAPAAKKPAATAPAQVAKRPIERRVQSPAPLPLGDDRDGTMLGQMLPPPPPLPRSGTNGRPPLNPRRSTRQAPPLPRPAPPVQKSAGGKLLVLLVVLILLGGAGVGGWFGYQKWFAKKDETQQPKPAEAALGKFGGIEIGSSGVKMMVVELQQSEDGIRSSVVDKASVDTNLAVLEEGTNNFAPANLRTTVSNVKIFYDGFLKAGIPVENIYVMCSSGILSRLSDQTAVKRNLDTLKSEIKSKVDKELDVVDASEEARFSVMAIVKKKDWQSTLLLDIGSGNTKGGGFEDRGFIDIEMKFGAKSFAGEVKKRMTGGESYQNALQRLTPTLVSDPLRKEFDRTRVLHSRKSIQLLGGIVWAMATYSHPEKQLENRSELTSADIKEFQTLLGTTDIVQRRKKIIDKLKSPDEKLTAQVEKDLDAIHKIFKPEELQAGAQILSAMDQEFQLAGKKIEFFRLGQYAWLLGYVLDKSGQLK